MTTIPFAIASLLYDHDTVIVPGFGAFVRHDRSAHVNVITNEFQRPSSSLSFDPQQREENSLVVEYIMACDDISEEEARTAVATFVNDSFARLKEEGAVTLPDLGTFTLDDHHDLVFDPFDEPNFNVDAFGLDDFNPKPVYGTENGERRTENGERNGAALNEAKRVKTENGETEVSVVEPTKKHRHTWWIWLLLLLLAVAGAALWYFKFRPVPTKPWTYDISLPERPVLHLERPSGDTLVEPHENAPENTPEVTPVVTPDIPENPEVVIPETPEVTPETPEVKPEETPEKTTPVPKDAPVEVILPDATSKAFIVGGCFEIEQYALNMATKAREQGCADAFVMKRGAQYLVCYGQYPATADAKAALPEILANYNAKAWILTK